jgi:serine/threonine protein kinase
MNAPLLPALPGYDNPELIAHGTTALVFRAIQTTLKRPVAIKVITIDTGSIPVNAARELATTVALSSQPHIVSIIDTGMTEDGRPYIVMEYCEGGSYAGILRQNGPLPVGDVLEVGVKIGEALHAAHQAGIVHRDVKPSNILRSRFGPALTDFGIARAPEELGTTLTRELMTPHHASPEALLHQAQSGISDVYSLASTMWTLLVGHPPFVDPGNPTMDMYAFRDRVLHDDLPPMPRAGVPRWLVAELRKAMSKLPAARHRSAMDFAESLRRGSLGLDPSAGAATALGGSPRIEPASPSVPSLSPAPAPSVSPAPSGSTGLSQLADPANSVGPLTMGQPSALGQPSTFVPPPASSVPIPYVPPATGSDPAPTPTPGPEVPASPAAPFVPAAEGPWASAPNPAPPRGEPDAPSHPRESGGATTGGSTGGSTGRSMRAPVIPPLPPTTAVRPLEQRPVEPFNPPGPQPLTPPTRPDRPSVPSAAGGPTAPPRPAPGHPPASWPGPTSALATPATPVPIALPPTPEPGLVGGWPPPPPGVPGTTGGPGRDEGGWLGSQRAPSVPRPRQTPPDRFDSSTLVAPPRSRGTLLAVLIVLALMAVAGAGILLVVSKGDGGVGVPPVAETQTPSPQATRFITASKEDAPKDVRILDQRGTTLTVTWTDPTNGTVPFVVNGKGPNDEKLDPKYLDRGTTSVSFGGLSPTKNYCFLVAAVYSTSHVAVADETCTKR